MQLSVSKIVKTLGMLSQQGFIEADLDFFTRAEIAGSHDFYATYVGMLLRGAEESDSELIEDALCVMGYRFELPITDGPKVDEIDGLA